MKKYANYIKQIEIDALWNGHKHIVWELDPEVNVLSGVNGVGKSTILNRIVSGVCPVEEGEAAGITISTEPADAEFIRFDVIRTPDVRSEFDTTLEALQERFVHCPDGPRRDLFCDIVDELFAATEKRIDRSCARVELVQWGEHLNMRQLSSGEKQMLSILMTVMLQDCEPSILFMDEPEVSLHIEWQQQLITTIRRLNPNVQIILTTHSPAIIMNGWMDKVTEVSDITVS